MINDLILVSIIPGRISLEIVDGELYAAEAFAPRLERVNLQTGDLEGIIDDWSLYYFYDVAWDGT